MKTTLLLCAVLLSVVGATSAVSFASSSSTSTVSADPISRRPIIQNPLIDYVGHLEVTAEVKTLREQRRLTETDFLKRSREAGAVLLDARSAPMFARLHIDGAVNLDFTEFTESSLAKIIPTKDTPIFIYCNNNFLGSRVAMVTKVARASLNISTFLALTEYGYTNVYELGPLLHVKTTTLPLVGTETSEKELR